MSISSLRLCNIYSKNGLAKKNSREETKRKTETYIGRWNQEHIKGEKAGMERDQGGGKRWKALGKTSTLYGRRGSTK